MSENQENQETVGQEEKSDQPTVEQQDRHQKVDPVIEDKTLDSEDTIALPITTFTKLLEVMKHIGGMSEKEVKSAITDKTQETFDAIIQSEKFLVPEGVYEEFNKNLDDLVNNIKYGDKDLDIRILGLNHSEGKLSGQTAIARLTSVIGVGEVVQVPLWHSGFWVAIKPPSQTDLINVEQAIANEQITLGRVTNTLVHSNYSVISSRIVMDFIIDNIVSTTLKVDGAKDIREYISLHDFPILVLGLISALYPKGINVTRNCVESVTLDKDNKPKCTFSKTAVVDPKKLVWMNRKMLNKTMVDNMCKRAPESINTDDQAEYISSIPAISTKVIEVKTKTGQDLKMKLKVPNMFDYLTNGERWVMEIITKAQELFSEADSVERKNMAVNEILTASILGIYNVFVDEIMVVGPNGDEVIGEEDIDESLTVLSSDNEVYVQFISKIRDFISESPIAVVGTPNFVCPDCGTEQHESINDVFNEIIPLNLLETFFALSTLRLTETRVRPETY